MQLEHSFTVPVPVADAWKVLLDIEQIAPCMPGAVLDSVDGDDFTGRVKVKLGPISLTYKGKASFVKKDEASHTAVIDAAGKDQRGNGTAAATVTATLKDEGGSSTRVDVLTDLNITGKPAQFGRGVMTDVGNKLIGQFASCVEGKLSASPSDAAADSTATTTASASASAADAVGTGDRSAKAADNGAASADDLVAASPTPNSGPSAGSRGDAAGSSAGGRASGSGGGAEETSASRLRAVPSREPEPIDLLEVAGGSVISRFGIPAAGLFTAITILFVIIRRIRN